MSTELLQKYADLMMQKRNLEHELEIMKQDVESYVSELVPDDKESHDLPSEFGTFSLIRKRKYIYSKEISNLESNIKEMKKAEEAKGYIPYDVIQYVQFKSN